MVLCLHIGPSSFGGLISVISVKDQDLTGMQLAPFYLPLAWMDGWMDGW